MSEHIGQQVAIPGTQGYGILRYLGPIQDKNGEFGGVELLGLLAKSRGKNSGSVNDIQYFSVKVPMSGLFLPIDRLISVNPQLGRYKTESSKSPPPSTLVKKAPLQSSSIQNRNELNVKSKQEGRIITPDSPNVQVITQSDSSNTSSSTSKNAELELEIQDLKQLYAQSQQEMAEKIEILNKLQSTVSEIVPLLEEYEKDLIEKDRKLLKQKTDFEKQREEWRSSMELMTSTQQETESFYESQLSELKQQFHHLSSSKDTTTETSNSLVTDLQHNLAEREIENNQLLTKIHNLQLSNEEMESKCSSLRESNKALETTIQELELEKAYNATILTQKINSVNLKDDLEHSQKSIPINNDQHKQDNLHLHPETGIDKVHAPRVEPVKVAKQMNAAISELPVYKPSLEFDPSQGKSNWCGLCEREGHSSIVCPFENDNDDIF